MSNKNELAVRSLLKNSKQLLKKELVLMIAAAVAAASSCLVPPSKEYLHYIDFRVLALLFCLMAVVKGYEKNGVFHSLAHRLLRRTKTLRGLSFVLVMLCFFSAAVITNDVALLTFVPFAVLVVSLAEKQQYLIYIIVMQTIAANLGSMLTPIGNPQNLYLYTYFNLSFISFLQITGNLVMVSFAGLSVFHFLLPKEEISEEVMEGISLAEGNSAFCSDNQSLLLYTVFLFLSMATVLRILHYGIAFGIIAVALLVADRQVLRQIDYGLLCTFVAFFIFVGNMKQLPFFAERIQVYIQGNELLASVALSQVISNVPAAVLLSGFTSDCNSLVVGTNIGGLGTLIASLASVISFKIYGAMEGAKSLRYFVVFTMLNMTFLFFLLAMQGI